MYMDIHIYRYIHIFAQIETYAYIWVNYNDLTVTSLGMMVNKGIHPKMALIQVSEILQFTHIYIHMCDLHHKTNREMFTNLANSPASRLNHLIAEIEGMMVAQLATLIRCHILALHRTKRSPIGIQG